MTSLDEFQEDGVFQSPKTPFIPRSYTTVGDFLPYQEPLPPQDCQLAEIHLYYRLHLWQANCTLSSCIF
jgi:hypothetical protein